MYIIHNNYVLGQPPAFLQCGDFVYPLIPGQSPILRSSYKAYVFPDPEAMDNSGNVGVMFNELPNEELKQLNIVRKLNVIKLNLFLCMAAFFCFK